MRTVKLFFANAALLASANILLRLIGVSFNTYVSEKLGAEGMGLFTLVMSVYGLALTLATSGVHLAATKFTAECLSDGRSVRAIMRGCFLYSLVFGTFSAVTLFSFSHAIGTSLLGDARTIPSLRALSLSLPAISLSSALSGYFTGVRRIYKNVISLIFEQFVKISLSSALLVLFSPAGITYACLAVVLGGAVSEFLSLAVSAFLYLTDKNRTNGKSAKGQDALRRVASVSLPTAVGSYARQGLLTAEHLAIPWGLKKSGASAATSLASYGVLHGMVFPLILFPSAVLGAFAGLLVPEFTEAKEEKNDARIRHMAKKVLTASLFFSIGVSAVFLSFSSEIGERMYLGTDAGRYISMLAPLIPVMYLDSAVDAMLKGLGEHLHCMKINIADSAVSLTLVVFLLPRFGMTGYVAVLYICELMNAALSISRLVSVSALRVRSVHLILLPTVGAIAATSAVRFLSAYGIPLIGTGGSFPARIIVCAVLYICFALPCARRV